SNDGGNEGLRIDNDGRVYLPGDLDASLGTGGNLVIGDVSGLNLTIDDNEILARNNGANSDLYIQNTGGTTYFKGLTRVNMEDGAAAGTHGLLGAHRDGGNSSGVALRYMANGTIDPAGLIRAM